VNEEAMTLWGAVAPPKIKKGKKKYIFVDCKPAHVLP
jgi:hypothetical protein